MPGHVKTNAWSSDDQILVTKLVNTNKVLQKIPELLDALYVCVCGCLRQNLILLRFFLFVRELFFIFAAKSQYIGIMTQVEIGNAIKERRKKLNINQQTLADLANVAVNTLVAIERGEGNPQLTTLLTIVDTLGMQIDVNIK